MKVDRIRNEVTRYRVKVTHIEDKMRETRFKWFGHVKRRNMDASMRRCEMINIPEGRKGRGQSKKSLDEVIRDDLKVVELTEDIAQDRRLWWDRIKVLNHIEIAS